MAGLAIHTLSRSAAAAGTNQIGLAQCKLDDDRDMALSSAWSILSAGEMERARRFHFGRDRDRYVRGRGFLRRLLGQISGQDPARLTFGSGPQGKPFLENNDLTFNLSHSRDLAVLAVSQAESLGIDLEFIDRAVDVAGLARTCLMQGEADVLAYLPEKARQARFFAFWTAKEARMKLTGEGLSLPPHQIVLDLHEGFPIGYLCPETPAAQAIFLDLGYPGALCCLALADGPEPIIKPLIDTAPFRILTPPFLTERA